MAKTKKYLEAEKIKSFILGQISFDELIDHIGDPNEVEFRMKGSYEISLEDVKEGMLHFIETEATYETVCSDWYENFYWYLGDMIKLPAMIGETGNIMELIDLGGAWNKFFFESKEDLANWVISRLEDMDDEQWSYEDQPEHCAESLKEIVEIIDNFAINQGKPREEWIFTHFQKEQLVTANRREEYLAKQDDVIKNFYKQFLEELVAEGNLDAIRDYGYAHYGDENPVYDCDWVIARDCMLKLMESGDDYYQAMAANTLGYIYYYGRCTDGEPDYENAYKFFSLAAFFGYFEATYKVGDMIRDGKGTFKNETAAFRLYERIYGENYERFVHGDGGVLSDVALRLASCYQHGTGTYKNLMTAYSYYLIARIAIDERMQHSNFFGLNTVSASIRSGLAEVRKELGSKVEAGHELVNISWFIGKYMLTGDCKELDVKVSETKSGYNITLKRLPKESYSDVNMVICYPEISYCKKSSEITFFLLKKNVIEIPAEEKAFKVNKIQGKKGEIHFYYKKKLMLSTSNDAWMLMQEKKVGSKKMHKFVTIQFTQEGRAYDYLCDGMDIKPGDEITVPGYQGPQKVKAIRVFEQSEADAPLEITKYKSVIQE